MIQPLDPYLAKLSRSATLGKENPMYRDDDFYRPITITRRKREDLIVMLLERGSIGAIALAIAVWIFQVIRYFVRHGL